MLFVLPGVLVLDALGHSTEAWARVGRSRWRWIGAFVVAPLGSLAATSFLPAILVLPCSFFYLLRVRALLQVATGLEVDGAGRKGLTPAQADALAPAFFVGVPVLAFLGIVLWTGDTRERLVALALGLPALAVAAYLSWTSLRRLDSRD